MFIKLLKLCSEELRANQKVNHPTEPEFSTSKTLFGGAEERENDRFFNSRKTEVGSLSLYLENFVAHHGKSVAQNATTLLRNVGLTLEHSPFGQRYKTFL